METTNGQNPEENGRTRKDIIENAQQFCHYVRAECQEVRSQNGQVPEDYRFWFQSAITNYYWALRPMREEPAVMDWWDEVELSDRWTHPETDEPFAGLDLINDVNELSEVVPVEKKTIRGRKTEQQSQPVALPFTILQDISGALDDAGARLGFTPSAPRKRQRFHMSKGGEDDEHPEPWGRAKAPE